MSFNEEMVFFSFPSLKSAYMGSIYVFPPKLKEIILLSYFLKNTILVLRTRQQQVKCGVVSI